MEHIHLQDVFALSQTELTFTLTEIAPQILGMSTFYIM